MPYSRLFTVFIFVRLPFLNIYTSRIEISRVLITNCAFASCDARLKLRTRIEIMRLFSITQIDEAGRLFQV